MLPDDAAIQFDYHSERKKVRRQCRHRQHCWTPTSSPLSECAGCCQQMHLGNKTSHQQNPPVLNWKCWLTLVDLYNGHKTVVVQRQKSSTVRDCQTDNHIDEQRPCWRWVSGFRAVFQCSCGAPSATGWCFLNSTVNSQRLSNTQASVWPAGIMVRALDLRLQKSQDWSQAVSLSGNNLGQVIHTLIYVLLSSIICHQSFGTLRLGR